MILSEVISSCLFECIYWECAFQHRLVCRPSVQVARLPVKDPLPSKLQVQTDCTVHKLLFKEKRSQSIYLWGNDADSSSVWPEFATFVFIRGRFANTHLSLLEVVFCESTRGFVKEENTSYELNVGQTACHTLKIVWLDTSFSFRGRWFGFKVFNRLNYANCFCTNGVFTVKLAGFFPHWILFHEATFYPGSPFVMFCQRHLSAC